MLSSHLQYTSQEYDQNNDARGVHPISVLDCEIITELIATATLLENDSLLLILDQWKNASDKKILSSLKQFNQDLEENGNGNEKEKERVVDYIEVQDEAIRVKDIFRIRKCEQYIEGRLMYSINFNPIHEMFNAVQGSLIVDAHFNFYTQEQRDQELDQIKQKLIENKKIKFI